MDFQAFGEFLIHLWLRSTRHLLVGAAICLVTMTAIVGCSKAKEPWEVTYPVNGVVTYQGKPIADARIRLIPQNPDFPTSVRPGARSDDDGNFVVGTNAADDGAPAGEYKVIVMQFPLVVSASGTTLGANTLPPKYAKAETTDLIVTIESEAKELPPLDLK